MDRSEHSRRVGILGGTFDPVHFGHLILAEYVRDELRLAEVRFLPARVPPHKERPDISPAQTRCRMLELALAGNENLSLCRLELERDGVSYSIETIRALRAMEPETEFYFIVGADALPEFDAWKDARELVRLCRFIVARRPGFARSEVPAGVGMLAGPEIDISSSRVRAYVREGRSIRYLVPEPVRNFIIDRRLYL